MGSFTLEQFFNPPPKARLLFQAVVDFIGEKVDVNSLKVQDITDRAGIGKGTAYEYFSSKEELITLALFFDYGNKIAELKELIDAKENFQDKMYCVLDWLHDNQGYHATFSRMIQISCGNQDLCQMIHSRIPQELFEAMNAYLLENVDAVFEQGYREGCFTETDKVKRRLGFATMITHLILSLEFMPIPKTSFFQMEYGELRTYAYETLIKILS